MVDCGLPGPFYNGYLDGQQTTFGAVIIFRCFGRTTFEGESTETTCQENGEWSYPVPKCWSKLFFYDFLHLLRSGVPITHGKQWQRHFLSLLCRMKTALLKLLVMELHVIRNCFLLWMCKFHSPFSKFNQHLSVKPKILKRSFFENQGNMWLNTVLVVNYILTIFIGKCEIPDIRNGSVSSYEPGLYVKHNIQIEINCNSGHRQNSNGKSACVNGTWSEMPGCDPGVGLVKNYNLNKYFG